MNKLAVKSKEEILEAIRLRVGEDESDEALALIEDIADTIGDYESKVETDGTDWKAKFEENDKEWRNKYKERFFKGEEVKDTAKESEAEAEPEKKTFEDLFSTEGE